jgi:hypothetical protein
VQPPSYFLGGGRISRDDAALTIQKEVRRYLKQLGFYEAHQVAVDESSPSPSISLFVHKRSKSNSRKHSPEQPLQSTTVIAELSGYKQGDIFGAQSGTSSEAESILIAEVAKKTVEKRLNRHSQPKANSLSDPKPKGSKKSGSKK